MQGVEEGSHSGTVARTACGGSVPVFQVGGLAALEYTWLCAVRSAPPAPSLSPHPDSLEL